MNALEALGVFGVLTPNNGTAGPNTWAYTSAPQLYGAKCRTGYGG